MSNSIEAKSAMQSTLLSAVYSGVIKKEAFINETEMQKHAYEYLKKNSSETHLNEYYQIKWDLLEDIQNILGV